VASFVMLFGFVGCFLDSIGEGSPDDGEEGRDDYKGAVQDHPNIAGYWRLSEEPGEPTAFDGTGVNNGTYVGGVLLGQPSLLASDADMAAQFDGSTAYVELPFILDASAPFTVECWVRPQALEGHPTMVAQRGGTGRKLLFVHNEGEFASNLGGTTFFSGFTVALDTTYYVVLTYAGGTDGAWVFYVDGFETAAGTVTGEPETDGWLIGADKSLETGFWNGTIDEVAVYNTALDASTIEAHFTIASTVPTP
jgi:hypothetical protein